MVAVRDVTVVEVLSLLELLLVLGMVPP